MSFLLDTNVCATVIRGKSIPVRRRLDREIDAGTYLGISSIVVFELQFGVAKSPHRDANARKLADFLAGPIDVLAFDEEDADRAAGVRAHLAAAGTPIGPYDMLIAGQALRHDLTLVTANVAEFARVPGLRWENWAMP